MHVRQLLVLAHGATGTWLDEIVEVGLPIAVFVGLWFWSSRKAKTKKKP
jgi:hypothetical protein